MEKGDRLSPGTMIGSFRIVGKIDEGGMGEVYEAHDDELNRRIAIKILLPGALNAAESLSRFKAEGRALAQLNHPNVVRLYLVGQNEGMHFMAMEYINGHTLDVHLMRYNCGLMDVLAMFQQMVEGLAAAHELDIIHRDIKPQNIMVDGSGKVKLVDFGIAKAQTEHDSFKTSTGIVLGTRSFLAPEVLRGQPATKQGDIYSLGLLFKFMLTGELPQISPQTDGVNRIPTNKFNVLFPQTLTNLVLGMIQSSTSLRYNDLKDVLRDLKLISFKDFHPDLLASIPKTHQIADLNKIYERCRQLGFDITESRMAVNLAAKLSGPSPVQKTDKTEVINLAAPPAYQVSDEALVKAMARVKQAKSQVLTARFSVPKDADHSPPLPIFKIAFLIIVGVLAYRIYVGDQIFSSQGVFHKTMSSFDPAIEFFRKAMDVQRENASVPGGLPVAPPVPTMPVPAAAPDSTVPATN